MNIFVLDLDFDKCASYHIDKHIVKMPLEAAQLLCTTHWVDTVLGFIPRALDKHEREELRKAKTGNRLFPYLPAMENHPCAIWARSSLDNYEWLFCYAAALGAEYTYRYGKIHKSTQVILELPEPIKLERVGLTPFAQAMPDQYKHENPVTAYRNYYDGEKTPHLGRGRKSYKE